MIGGELPRAVRTGLGGRGSSNKRRRALISITPGRSRRSQQGGHGADAKAIEYDQPTTAIRFRERIHAPKNILDSSKTQRPCEHVIRIGVFATSSKL